MDSTKEEREGSKTPDADPMATIEGVGGRSRRKRRVSNDTVGQADAEDVKKPRLEGKKDKSTKRKKKEEEAEDMEWVCALCKEADCHMLPSADKFLICDGGCHRVFHYPCAGLAKLPKEDEDWICRDCMDSRHQCAYCQEYGQDYVDVFPCRKNACGLFFHQSCLRLNNVPITLEPKTTEEGGEEIEQSPRNVEADLLENDPASTVPVFTCPAHHCWTCTQEDALRKEQEEAAANRKEQGGKKMRKKQRQASIYICKTEKRIFRCLHCPTSFHVTCLPPTAKCNELGVLCPEHATGNKLPDIDHSDSIQRRVEEKIEQKLDKISSQNRARRLLNSMENRGSSANRFFPGLRGDRLVKTEQAYVDTVTEQSKHKQEWTQDVQVAAIESVCGTALPFCLPIDIKNEVLSKPPNYTHLNALRYDPSKRPKKTLPAGEQCQCTETCDQNCYNRMALTECWGEGPNSNCRLGPHKCGNRGLGKRQYVKCKPKRETGKGWGLVTLEEVSKGNLVLEYVGEVINEAEKERRLIEWSKDHPNDPNFYIMGLGIGWYVDAREYANMSRFINHSCDPNCKVITMEVRGYRRNGIYALRDLKAGEFLSYDYHFDTNQADKFSCRCGAKKCRGTMQGRGGAESKKPRTWKEAKAQYENDMKQLEDLAEKQTISQVDAVVPEATQATELVALGPQDKHRDTAIRNRLFLWRNAVRGSNFVARQSRIEARVLGRVDAPTAQDLSSTSG